MTLSENVWATLVAAILIVGLPAAILVSQLIKS